MKILIVDDERAYRTLLFDYLNPNHQVSVVADGVSAVALLSAPTAAFDLVILDLRMPFLEGDVLLESFAQWHSCRHSFLVVSGAMDPTRFKDIPAVVGCLQKPFPLKDLDPYLKGEKSAQALAG